MSIWTPLVPESALVLLYAARTGFLPPGARTFYCLYGKGLGIVQRMVLSISGIQCDWHFTMASPCARPHFRLTPILASGI
jgi:hypothetical protein